MNVYEILREYYEANNEYDAVKSAHKMANRIELMDCIDKDTWRYRVFFNSGCSIVRVKKIN